MSGRRYRPVRICALPVDIINRTLGTELSPGDAWLSQMAHRHFAEDHAVDYAVCFPLLSEVIENPTWLGQAPAHAENFELVTRIVRFDRIVLAAVRLQPNKSGNYNVVSVYCIKQSTVEARRRSLRLAPAIKSPLLMGGGFDGWARAGMPFPDLLTDRRLPAG